MIFYPGYSFYLVRSWTAELTGSCGKQFGSQDQDAGSPPLNAPPNYHIRIIRVIVMKVCFQCFLVILNF